MNVEGTRNLVEGLARKLGTPVVFASSISTYGPTWRKKPPTKEDHPKNAHNIYVKSKIEAEWLIWASGVPHVILRIAPIAIASLVELPDIVPYRADQRVEFVYVEDAVRAIVSAMTHLEARGQTFNIPGGPSWQMTGREYIGGFYDALWVEVDPVFSEEYTALDWYDTSRSRCLGYQKTTFNGFLDRLRVLGEELGLR